MSNLPSMERKPLIIAEKPSAAQAIAEAVGGFTRRNGYLESAGYYLTWAVGHLVELMAPEEYDPRWKRWSLESLPIIPAMFGLKVAPKTRSQFQVITNLAQHAPELINACDAAREGELIFRYICEAAKITRPVRRLWVSSLTGDAIREAFASLRPSSEYDRLYQSALCRAHGDWLVGMNATRAFTVKWGELFSVGRVQTPTLALLVRREDEIEAFNSEPYWEVTAQFRRKTGQQYTGKWFDETGDRIKSAEVANAIARRVEGEPGSVLSVTQKPIVERPPQLYDLTTLQREANRRFGLTAAATLKTAQNLYEAKLITYPRTDSRYIGRDLVPTLPGIVRTLGVAGAYASLVRDADLGLVHPLNRRVVDDAKVTDHHAILPTAERPSGLKGTEVKIYDLVARRLLAQFFPEARYEETEVITVAGPTPDKFRSKGRQVVQVGWRVVEPEPQRSRTSSEERPVELPLLTPDLPVTVASAEAEAKETQPPRRYTEASLLAAMETAGKAIDDEALKEAMKGRGLGTPATRASIIERLKDVGYITLDKKALVPTEKGRRLVTLTDQAGAQFLLSAELTGDWEKRIANIQAGTDQAERFMADIRGTTVHLVDLARKAPGERSEKVKEGSSPQTVGTCPRCGRSVVKMGRGWRCANQQCALDIPGWLCGKAIDHSLAAALLTNGRTPVIEGFKSPRTGKTFRAYLVWKDGKVGFEFPPNKEFKQSGYRRAGVGGETDERTAAAKARPRSSGSRAAGSAGATSRKASGTGMGRGSSGKSKPSGTGRG